MVRGRPQKDSSERIRRNTTEYECDVVEWDGVTRGPELPLGLPGIKWSTMTIKWWKTWRESAQAMLMIETDWEVMLETALLHNEFWKPAMEAVTGANGKITKRAKSRSAAELKSLAGEIRQRLEAFGATYRDRQTRRIKVVTKMTAEEKQAQARMDAEETVSQIDYIEMFAAEAAKQKKK